MKEKEERGATSIAALRLKFDFFFFFFCIFWFNPHSNIYIYIQRRRRGALLCCRFQRRVGLSLQVHEEGRRNIFRVFFYGLWAGLGSTQKILWFFLFIYFQFFNLFFCFYFFKI
ncbi:hypothetical protein Hanom_Chr02g00162161 [Helianthus anomalus]